MSVKYESLIRFYQRQVPNTTIIIPNYEFYKEVFIDFVKFVKEICFKINFPDLKLKIYVHIQNLTKR